MTRARTLRELEDRELEQHLTDARTELFNLRFQLATGRLDNVSRIVAVRKDIARVLTLLGERELGIERAVVAGRPSEQGEA